MARTAPRRLTQSRGGFEFVKYAGGLRWAVHVPSNDDTSDTHIGYATANGSRIKERSWDWKAADGTEGKTSTRQNAAEALARHAARSAS